MQLPAPKNDFEIVVPDMEEMEGGEGEEVRHGYVEDAAEVQERAAALKREEGGERGDGTGALGQRRWNRVSIWFNVSNFFTHLT